MLVAICYTVAIGAAYLLTSEDSQLIQDAQAIDAVASSVTTLIDPHPSISPEQVVRIQLRSLSDEDVATGVIQCMHFASPDNRAVTGPLERFGAMLRNQKFRPLSRPDQLLIGSSNIVQGKARVVVTLIVNKQLSSFVWVLSKQDAAPYQECWMTEAVIPIGSEVPGRNEI